MKPRCLIVDIDNTLLMSDTPPYKEEYEFEVNEFVKGIVKDYPYGDFTSVILSTWRPARIREKTIKELKSVGIFCSIRMLPVREMILYSDIPLFMNTYRENGKTFTWPRAKEENLKLIMKEYEVEMVIDDDPVAIEMYKSYGLNCLQMHKWKKE